MAQGVRRANRNLNKMVLTGGSVAIPADIRGREFRRTTNLRSIALEALIRIATPAEEGSKALGKH